MRSFFVEHARQFMAALGRLARHPGSTLLTIGVIGIALSLPAGLRVVVNNGRLLAGSWEHAQDFTVYLKMEVSANNAAALAEQIRSRSDVASVTLINRSDALEDFKRYSGFGDVLRALDTNPLPHALVVRPQTDLGGDQSLGGLAEELDGLDGTELVQLDTAWVDRFRAMLDISRRAVDLATALLALAVVVVIGNTIRLEINNRRREIEVTKLVGGSNGFIRRPFLYLGFWYGLGGGLLAWILITVGLTALSAPVAQLAGLYTSNFALTGLPWLESLVLGGGGGVLGWFGAGVAASRHLAAIEPE
jgi:cell division transport system permease protein